MQCGKGHENPNGSQFCNVCGERLSPSPPPEQAQPSDASAPQPPAPPLPDHEETAAYSEQREVGSTKKSSSAEKRKWLIVGGIAAVVAVVGIVMAVISSRDDSILIRGTSSLNGEIGGDQIEGTWDDCEGTGGYDDFRPRQNVRINDAAGVLIGTGTTESLSEERLADLVEMERYSSRMGLELEGDEGIDQLREFLSAMADLSFSCFVYWEVEVPKSDFYSIEIGRRGELNFSFEELESQGFVVSTSLGG